MKAMVLAAGFGTRLQPLTHVLPKPMFPVLGRPLLSHTFDILESANITDVAVNVHHLPDFIINYFEKKKLHDLNLHFSREEKILGTAGGIKKMEGFLEGGPFILINSDIITDIKLDKVIDFHKKNGKYKDAKILPVQPGLELDIKSGDFLNGDYKPWTKKQMESFFKSLASEKIIPKVIHRKIKTFIDEINSPCFVRILSYIEGKMYADSKNTIDLECSLGSYAGILSKELQNLKEKNLMIGLIG